MPGIGHYLAQHCQENEQDVSPCIRCKAPWEFQPNKSGKLGFHMEFTMQKLTTVSSKTGWPNSADSSVHLLFTSYICHAQSQAWDACQLSSCLQLWASCRRPTIYISIRCLQQVSRYPSSCGANRVRTSQLMSQREFMPMRWQACGCSGSGSDPQVCKRGKSVKCIPMVTNATWALLPHKCTALF